MTRNTGRAQCIHTAHPCNKARLCGPGEWLAEKHGTKLTSFRYFSKMRNALLTSAMDKP
jgi:hypothetical protein